MAAQLQTCKICNKRLAEVLMIKVQDPRTDLGYSWLCPGHNVKAKQPSIRTVKRRPQHD